MVSFRYTSILFYTILCFSAGTSNGVVNPQNETILAKVRRDAPTFTVDTALADKVVANINTLRDGKAENARDMTHVAYSKCLAEIAEDVIKKCNKDAKIEGKKYGANKKIDAIFLSQASTESATLDTKITGLSGNDLAENTFICAADSDCVNYAKALNSGSYEVGCATHTCSSLKPGNVADQTLFLCLLGPEMFEGGKAPFVVAGSGDGEGKCSKCKNAECKETAGKICKNPKDFVATADKCPASKKNDDDDSGDDKKGDKKTSGKKKSMGVQSVKPQTVLAVAVTAILSLFLAH